MRYVALLRGIGPINPNMRNEKLRGVFEALGFGNVATVITTGNVVFDADTDDAAAIEDTVEAAWPERLGFRSTTIVRSADELHDLIDAAPFGDLAHGAVTSLDVTFLKHEGDLGVELPYTPDGGAFTVLCDAGRALCTVSTGNRPEFPRLFERRLGKEITTRTWRTVERIAARL